MSTQINQQKIYHERPVVVAGATGKQGGAVARRLLANGHRVRALTRNPDSASAKALAQLGADIVRADLEDPPSLVAALADAGAVFSVQDFLESGVEAELRQGLNLTAAAADSSIEHLIYSGASTMDRNTGVPHLESKWQVETAVRRLDKPWTVFRPSAFMENWSWDRDAITAEGVMYFPGRPDMVYRQVSVQDIAALVVMALENPSVWVGNIASLAGDAMTPLEMAATFAKVLQREVRYQQIDWDTCRDQQGLELTAMYRYFDEFGMDGDSEQLKFWHQDALGFEAFLR